MRKLVTEIEVNQTSTGYLTLALKLPDDVSDGAALEWLRGSAGGLTSVYADRIDWHNAEPDLGDVLICNQDKEAEPAGTLELVATGLPYPRSPVGCKLPEDSPYAFALAVAGIIGKEVAL